MTFRKFLQIAACVLAIPAGGGLGACTQQEREAAFLIIGGAVAVFIIASIVHSGKSNSDSSSLNVAVNSDARLKTEIKPVARLPNGLMLYSFKFRSDPTTTYVGVLAQDLLNSDNAKFRHAVVVNSNGYYAVKYDELGLKMFTLDEWKVVSAEVCSHPEAKCSYIEMGIHVPGTGHLAFAR